MADIRDFTNEQIETAIKAEAIAHAEFFGYQGDAEGIASREQASRANVRHIDRTGEELDLCDYLIPYIVASDEKSEFATPQIAVDRELLAVLNEAADFIQPFTRGQELLARIEAAIAKAEGRS